MSFDECWNRIQKETNIKNLTQLAKIVGTSQSNTTKKKQKGEFPAEWAFRVGQDYNLLTEWIMTGQGPKRIGIESEEGYFSDLKKWAKETGQSENIEWMKNQIDQTFPMFKEWRKRRDETKGQDSEAPAI